MAGHSKWAQIKRKKAATDAKRGKLFTRLLREVQVAARMGGAIEGNPRLKTAVQAAKDMSVPGDNIERAIKRGAGGAEGADYEEIVYEGYGPGGVSLIIRSLTDNRNRTASEVRHALTRFKGTLGSTNSVAHNFVNRGVISIPKDSISEDELFSIVLDAGADDVVAGESAWEVHTDPESFNDVRKAVENLKKEFEADLRLVPTATIPVTGETARDLLKLLDVLDDLDDVQSVTANFEIDEKELANVG